MSQTDVSVRTGPADNEFENDGSLKNIPVIDPQKCWISQGSDCRNIANRVRNRKLDLCLKCPCFRSKFLDKSDKKGEKILVQELWNYVQSLEDGILRLQDSLINRNAKLVDLLEEAKEREHQAIVNMQERESLTKEIAAALEVAEERKIELEEIAELATIKEQILNTSIKDADALSQQLSITLENLDKTTVSKDYVNNIINLIGDSLLIITTPDRIIERVNKLFITVSGYCENELIGKPIDMLIEESELLFEKENFSRIISQEYTSNREIRCRKKDGHLIPILLSISVLKSQDNTAQVLIFSGADITLQKKTEEELKLFTEKLKQSNRELEDFASIASHDLQEPLRKVIIFGDRLKSKCVASASPEMVDYVDRMQSATKRMQTLIDNLLSFSRVTSKGRPLVPTDVNQILHEVISDLEIRLKQTNGRIEYSTFPTIDSDPMQIRQLFQNLIGNALKFHKPEVAPVIHISGKELTVSPGDEHEMLFTHGIYEFTFQDNGIGFDNKYSDKIFGIFQRLHSSSEYEGTGIGLAICKKIVERHNGTIVATGEPGVGSRFVITMPIKQIVQEAK